MASEYIRRAIQWRQMDLDYTFFQMLFICCSPKKLYQLASWRKRTKNQWARDDPAFIVILAAGLIVSSLAYSIAFRAGFVGFFLSSVWTILVELLACGAVCASVTHYITKNYMIKEDHDSSELEWLFSFDIHCNSYLPVYLLTHVIQYFFLPVLLGSSFPCVLLSVLLYSSSLAFYCLHTVAGYSVMPIVRRTEIFLAPTLVLAPAFLACLLRTEYLGTALDKLSDTA
mmetsp:Transcript_19998/g.37126  ORF Transcript_19998/g.37126 Transcript_19998/m.37126 type:complete len:228 (+) Transcript_19998:527-1210(+)